VISSLQGLCLGQHNVQKQCTKTHARSEIQSRNLSKQAVMTARPHGHQDRHKHDLNWLLKWRTAYINFGWDIRHQFQCNMPIMVVGNGRIPYRWSEKHAGNQLLHIHIHSTLITAWNKTYYGFLRMRDFRAGRLKRLKHETSFFQRPGREAGFSYASSCALTFEIHCSILPARRPSRLRLARTLRCPYTPLSRVLLEKLTSKLCS